MPGKLQRTSILKKTARVSFSLLFSKFLGVLREIIQVSYLGVGSLSDAFNAAMKVPSVLRKLFAEGALSAAFVPTIIRVTKDDSQEQASRLMTLTYLVFGSGILVLCLLISWYPAPVIYLVARGFSHKPVEMASAIGMIRILIFFVFFIFSSALLASALQAKMHFTIPAWGPALINVFYISGLLISIYAGLSVDTFCYFLLLGGLAQTLLYASVYFRLNFKILWPDKRTYAYFKEVVRKFIPCFMSVSIIEINLIIDYWYASQLPAGSLTLLSTSSKFMTIALGAFAVAFSTILLPHFTHVTSYAPKRLGYYLLEAAKFIFWVTAPIALAMSFFSYDIFYTIFYRLADDIAGRQVITLEQVRVAASLLVAFLPGLFFFSLNKVILSIYYAFRETRYTFYITVISAFSNVLLNRLLMPSYGAQGIAVATVIAGMLQTLLLLVILRKKLAVALYIGKFIEFVGAYLVQLGVFLGSVIAGYSLGVLFVMKLMPGWADILLHHVGLWLWVGPLCLLAAGLLYYVRNKAGVRLYFLR